MTAQRHEDGSGAYGADREGYDRALWPQSRPRHDHAEVMEMSLPTWPEAVPYEPFDDLWKNTPIGNTHLVTEMEAGNVRVRRRPWVWPVLEWGRLLKPDAMAAFKTFIESDIYEGSSRFRMMAASMDRPSPSARCRWSRQAWATPAPATASSG